MRKICCAATMLGCQIDAQGPAAKPMPLMMMTWFRDRMMRVESGHPAGCPTSSGTARSNFAIRDSRRIRTCTLVTPFLSGDDKHLMISGMFQVSIVCQARLQAKRKIRNKSVFTVPSRSSVCWQGSLTPLRANPICFHARPSSEPVVSVRNVLGGICAKLRHLTPRFCPALF